MTHAGSGTRRRRRTPQADARRARDCTTSLATLLVACVLAAGCAEPRTDTAAVSAAMDSVYARFTRAYRIAEPDSVVALYTAEPLYLPGQGPILRGTESVRQQFSFLDNVAGRGATAHITFESVDRDASGDIAYDIGYYTLRTVSEDGTESPPSRGKFATIWKRGEDGVWRIHADSFSPAPPTPSQQQP